MPKKVRLHTLPEVTMVSGMELALTKMPVADQMGKSATVQSFAEKSRKPSGSVEDTGESDYL